MSPSPHTPLHVTCLVFLSCLRIPKSRCRAGFLGVAERVSCCDGGMIGFGSSRHPHPHPHLPLYGSPPLYFLPPLNLPFSLTHACNSSGVYA
ncbi:hypothetical protein PILCRDRAFT_810335 [Piloderma croceum F 1598]|uniref:Uncharacterized protein n=1 Tax=Piloderma croceum (strain F 1598) TaxID=765440 RepID=A0A0C3GL24_PILCF|nr:hypothetical protein PILCRDRAFT_810335 [Piloderma croceum F 1598]